MPYKNSDLPPSEERGFNDLNDRNSDNSERPFKTTPDNFLTNEGINVFEEARKYMIERGKQMRSKKTT